MADRTALFTVGANPRWQPSPCCKNFKWRYLRNQSSDPLRFKQIQDGGCRHLGKILNGHLSATGRPIHFMFCYRVGFSGTADLIALFLIRTNFRWWPPPSWILKFWMAISPKRLMIYLYSAHRVARSSLR